MVHLARLERFETQPPVLRPATILGMRLIGDAPRPALAASAVARSVVRSNPPLEPFEALLRATAAVADAQAQGISPGFFAATILQESAFDDRALSYAGAVGIAQFEIETADGEGIDPFDWRSALRGSAQLFGEYARDYANAPDPYALSLAAYNAGPAAVAHYGGVPPFPETMEYIGLVYERWSRIVRDMHAGCALFKAGRCATKNPHARNAARRADPRRRPFLTLPAVRARAPGDLRGRRG